MKMHADEDGGVCTTGGEAGAGRGVRGAVHGAAAAKPCRLPARLGRDDRAGAEFNSTYARPSQLNRVAKLLAKQQSVYCAERPMRPSIYLVAITSPRAGGP